MMLRMLLVLVAVAGLSMGGCKKQEPAAPAEEPAASEQVEEAADEAAADVKEAVE
ncbi:MAG: hypothetical protein OEV87_12630 [Phycisphaerae bacterium]|nr:hypothetical protein [Phycisphaerae bacterium]